MSEKKKTTSLSSPSIGFTFLPFVFFLPLHFSSVAIMAVAKEKKKRSGGSTSADAATTATAADRKGKGKAAKSADAIAADGGSGGGDEPIDVLPANRNLVVPKGRPVRVYADGENSERAEESALSSLQPPARGK